MSAIPRYWRTLRHLKPVQVLGRVRFKVARPVPNIAPAPPVRKRDAGSAWKPPAARRASMTGAAEFRFLNSTQQLDRCGWNPADLPKLWVYNLHYFDDLCAQDAAQRTAWHTALMRRWVAENPPGTGNGWEPYPTSLRIANWIKWSLAGNALPPECVQSLAVQARWLVRRLEWHILGNHLFVNAKALVLAGLFFEGPEADQWLSGGAAILREQIPEQILADGGQFERSPMYHALALEDMLDLCNALRAYAALPDLHAMVAERIQPMREWLSAMCHPDGEISFFNDAAMGIAPAPAELDAYAQRLGFAALAPMADGIVNLAASGYIRVQQGPMVALLDVAPVGPDYLPGHAHADTLSFELSLHGTRVLMNSGTSEYGTGPQRQTERGTAAHNTVVIDGQDSSEVWGGFRVGRRAVPHGLSVGRTGDAIAVTCAHDGYSHLGSHAAHTRQWQLSRNALRVTDSAGGPSHTAVSMWHLGPQVKATEATEGVFHATLPTGNFLRVGGVNTTLRLQDGAVHPEFGASVPAQVLTGQFTEESQVWMEWD